MTPSLLKSSSFSSALKARAGGFALLITITLLSFVVLLLVGLATYTRIETAISGNTQKQAQARQNALLALDVALGQLQKHAGPDQRVTATAASFGGGTGTNRYTGVWDATTTGTTPNTWLVSGNETNALAFKPTTTLTATNAAELVGLKTSALANDVRVPLVPITTVGVPGQATTATIGRYGWWVGDQGVKAPVAVLDKSASVSYSPWTDTGSTDLRERIRQQISLGALASDATAAILFDAQSSTNATLVSKLPTTNQLTFLNKSTSGTLGLAGLQARFHDWSPDNFNVLANTASNSSGLRQDLSLDPSLIGSAAKTWLDYTTYMEAPVDAATSDFPPVPDITLSSLRRRYVMQPGPPAIAPVLSYFLLSFNIRTKEGLPGLNPLEARAFWKVGLWNPYTSSFLPESNLRVEVTGLPQLKIINDDVPGAPVDLSLQKLYGGTGADLNPLPLKIILPWDSNAPSNQSGLDRLSWLPGRVYNWRSIQDVSGAVPTDGYRSRFYSKSYTPTGELNNGIIQSLPDYTVDGDAKGHIEGTAATILVKIYAVRSSGDVELASFSSPPFASFKTDPKAFSGSLTQFVYFFRLRESSESPNWLVSANSEPRQNQVDSSVFVYGPQGDSPSAYTPDYADASFPSRLLDRAPESITYNEDVPVFELPRSPLLSLGMLQHLAIDGARPFSIGNSWGATTTINSIPSAQLFDQFFFSGLVAGVNPNGSGASLVLPNPLLRVAPRISTGAATSAADLRSPADARSSKYLLQGGAFNLNSTSIPAWASVLRTVRFTTPATAFKYLNADSDTGTASTSGETTLSVQSTDAHFLRFSQSAQETYKAEAGLSAGGSTSVTPPKTELFRQGMVTLNSTQVQNLASKIIAAIRAHQAASGPFRTLEEFLSPSANATSSLLEQAIADAGINVDAEGNPIEFSSQFLTQADIMTALAPVLFVRSDTFIVRTYGEAVNPATGVTEGKAWCEAIVQRIPDYFDSSDDATLAPGDLKSVLNTNLGRRFKVVSFRWLTRSDI